VPQKLYIRTFGCQMNEYDSDKMADVLAASDGLALTDRPEDADVILFNTCSVRERAQERVFHDLGRVRALKAQNPDLIIGVGGCVASQEGAAIVKRAPHVDVVFGPQTLHRLPELIRERRLSGRAQVDISFPAIEKFDHLTPPSVDGTAAFVSIMEGCSKYCTFCVVPYTRGEKSLGRSTMCLPKSPTPPTRACWKSPCSDRTSTPTAAGSDPTTKSPIWPSSSSTSRKFPASSAFASRRRTRRR
jgi:tRNA-2-methylthio-N6-dimethylallyladenosine synthase